MTQNTNPMLPDLEYWPILGKRTEIGISSKKNLSCFSVKWFYIGFVCTFSWKENKCDTIPKRKIWGFMCNNKSLVQIEDLEDQKTILLFCTIVIVP